MLKETGDEGRAVRIASGAVKKRRKTWRLVLPDTATDKYDLTKPQVEGSQDTWGDKLNQDLDEIDALLFNRVVKAAIGKEVEDGASEPENPQVMELALQLPGQAPVPAGTDDMHNGHIAATLDWVEYRIISLLNRMFPVGTIMLWSGSIDSTITLNHLGWTLCNGSGGSPNLNDRIVLAPAASTPPASLAVLPGQVLVGTFMPARRPSTQVRRQGPTSLTTSMVLRITSPAFPTTCPITPSATSSSTATSR